VSIPRERHYAIFVLNARVVPEPCLRGGVGMCVPGLFRGFPVGVCVALFTSNVRKGRFIPVRDPIRRHYQAGSLTGAVHLSKNNAGVLRLAQRGQKPRVEQKGKC
jgi:hypothetical protein